MNKKKRKLPDSLIDKKPSKQTPQRVEVKASRSAKKETNATQGVGVPIKLQCKVEEKVVIIEELKDPDVISDLKDLSVEDLLQWATSIIDRDPKKTNNSVRNTCFGQSRVSIDVEPDAPIFSPLKVSSEMKIPNLFEMVAGGAFDVGHVAVSHVPLIIDRESSTSKVVQEEIQSNVEEYVPTQPIGIDPGHDIDFIDVTHSEERPHKKRRRGADVNGRDRYGSTALHYAARYGYLDIATLLLEHGADIEAKDNGFIMHLIMHGADIEAKTNNGTTALHHASYHDIEARDNNGWTGFYWASRNGRIDAAQCLINHNADVNAQSTDLKIALHRVLREENPDVASLLIEYGDLADKDGLTSLQLILNNHGTEFLQECLDKRQQRIFDLSDFRLTCTDLYYAFPLAWIVAEFIHGDMPKIKQTSQTRK